MSAIQQALLAIGGGGSSDPYFSHVSALLHMDGPNGSTTFTDVIGNSWTPSGTDAISTSQYKFGGASAKFDGTSVGLVSASIAGFGMGSGDYTLECFAYSNNTSTKVGIVFDLRTSVNTGVAFFMGGGAYAQPPNIIGCSSNSAVLATGGTVTTATWYHLALCRASGTLYGFINGTLAFSVSDTRTYASATTLYIGSDAFGTAPQKFDGWIDEVRITKGIARYTSNFTPPSSPFPNS